MVCYVFGIGGSLAFATLFRRKVWLLRIQTNTRPSQSPHIERKPHIYGG